MKKIYSLKESELNNEDKEFKSTAYGKRLYNIKISSTVGLFVCLLAYAFSSAMASEESNIADIIFDNISWLIIIIIIIIGGCFEEIIRFKYNNALKEYIESKNE